MYGEFHLWLEIQNWSKENTLSGSRFVNFQPSSLHFQKSPFCLDSLLTSSNITVTYSLCVYTTLADSIFSIFYYSYLKPSQDWSVPKFPSFPILIMNCLAEQSHIKWKAQCRSRGRLCNHIWRLSYLCCKCVINNFWGLHTVLCLVCSRLINRLIDLY